MARTPCPAAADLVRRFEGLADGDRRRPGLQAYLCPAGLPTVGIGHLLVRHPGHGLWRHPVSGEWLPDWRAVTIDAAEAEGLFAADLARAGAAVAALCPVPLGDRQFGALASFVFNLGPARLASSTLRRRVLRGDHGAAAAEFERWVYAGGVRLAGLVRRRAAERALYEGFATKV
ncbi:MAG TPA: lysozyme [Alphaproteobacteria bacterium]|nr:lysozyme [Alphaproteobacteria bacterium]